MNLLYVDTSAMVKRLVDETESDAFDDCLATGLARGDVFVSSALLGVELRRFAIREDIDAAEVEAAIANASIVAVSDDILESASRIPHHVKTLDAIHLATAMALTDDSRGPDSVSTIVTYDATMARAGRRLGYEIVMPGI